MVLRDCHLFVVHFKLLMKKSKIGQYYENFQNQRVYINKGENKVTLKMYHTFLGRQYELKWWICISWASGKPIVYRSLPYSSTILNISYSSLKEELSMMLDGVSGKDIKVKKEKLLKKFIKLCNNFFQECKDIDSINAKILKIWFPLLDYLDNNLVLLFIPALSQQQPIFRKGLKESNIRIAVKKWFGKAPKGLVRRVATLLKPEKNKTILNRNISKLILAISCHKWKIDYIYQLLDMDIKWDASFDIKQTRTLLNAYSPKRWLIVFQNDIRSGKLNLRYEIYDTIYMYANATLEERKALPARPSSFEEIHDAIADYLEKTRILRLQDKTLPENLSYLDEAKVYSSKDSCLKIRIPKVGKDLISWGKQLNNCLISYVERVLKKECFIVGIVDENNSIKYALNICNKSVVEFSGINNSIPLEEDEKAVRKFLLKHNFRLYF